MKRDPRYTRAVAFFAMSLMMLGGFWLRPQPMLFAEPGSVQVQMPQISINKADAAALEQVKGIGPELASRIIAYRQEHGPFKSLEELQSVRGIGPVKLEKIKAQVTL